MRTRARTAARLFAATVLAGLVAGGGGGGAALAQEPPANSVGIRLVDASEDARDDPRAQTYIVDDVHPGDTVTRRVEVTNTTATELPIEVYAGAARRDGDEFVSLDPGTRNPLVRWTAVAPGVLTLAPGAHALATVTITVPEDARLGEHYGVVWAQPPASQDGTVATVNRVGIRIYLSVADVGGGAFPWLLIAVPALAILVGAGAVRAGRARRRGDASGRGVAPDVNVGRRSRGRSRRRRRGRGSRRGRRGTRAPTGSR
jgi:hypothetical protein